MQVIKKHIAASGAKAGQWVNCPAEKSCRLKGSRHITEKQFFAASAWMSETGNKTLLKDITLKDIETFLRLPAADLDKWNGKARAHLLKMRGIKNAGAGYDPFVKYTREEEIKRVKEIMENPQRKKSGVSFASLTDAEKEEKLNEKLLGDDSNLRAGLKKSIQREEEIKRLNAWSAEKAELAKPTGRRVATYDMDVKLTIQEFEDYKMEAIENGGELEFSDAVVLDYADGRPSEIKITGLKITATQENLNVLKERISDEHNFVRSARNISFSMKKKDYENFLQDSSRNPNIRVYPQQITVTQKSFGREFVTGSFDVQGKDQEINRMWERLDSKDQANELSMRKVLTPKATKYHEPVVDKIARNQLHNVYRNLKVASAGSADRLTLEEQHFLDRARTKYLPDLVSNYSRLQNDSSLSKEDKAEAATIFKQQLDIVSRKTDSIKKKHSSSKLDSMRVDLSFLEDRASA